MLKLFDFLYKQRILLLFLFLEAISLWLIFVYNNRYNTYYINSSNRIAGEVNSRVNSVEHYFSLREANNDLFEENLALRKLLANMVLAFIIYSSFFSYY